MDTVDGHSDQIPLIVGACNQSLRLWLWRRNLRLTCWEASCYCFSVWEQAHVFNLSRKAHLLDEEVRVLIPGITLECAILRDKLLAEHKNLAGIDIQLASFGIFDTFHRQPLLILLKVSQRAVIRQIAIHLVIEKKHVCRVVVHLDCDEVWLFGLLTERLHVFLIAESHGQVCLESLRCRSGGNLLDAVSGDQRVYHWRNGIKSICRAVTNSDVGPAAIEVDCGSSLWIFFFTCSFFLFRKCSLFLLIFEQIWAIVDKILKFSTLNIFLILSICVPCWIWSDFLRLHKIYLLIS